MREENKRQFVIHHTTDGRSPSEYGPGDLYGEVMGHLTPTGGHGMSEREKLGYSPYCSGNPEYPPDEPNVGPVDSDEVYCWMNRDLLGDQKCDELGELFASAPELKAEVGRLRAELAAVTEDRNRWLLSFGQLSAQVNPVTDEAAWEYVRTRWAEVLKRLGDE